jgi:hypothetical protein
MRMQADSRPATKLIHLLPASNLTARQIAPVAPLSATEFCKRSTRLCAHSNPPGGANLAADAKFQLLRCAGALLTIGVADSLCLFAAAVRAE